MNRRHFLHGAAGVLAVGPLPGCTSLRPARREPYRIGRLIYQDNFDQGLALWSIEAEKPATVTTAGGMLEIDTPEGLTAWFRPRLQSPVLIEYEAMMVSKAGPNDRVSDLNAFWMATDARSPDNILDKPRSGAFASYDAMRTYYVGQGGNYNKTTRFRRYIGESGNRPILPEHDLSGSEDLLLPNVWQTVRLIAYQNLIQYWRDGRKVFEFWDPEPYTEGWFGIRTTKNHMQVRKLRIYSLNAR